MIFYALMCDCCGDVVCGKYGERAHVLRRRAKGWKRKPVARWPWKAKEAQWWVAFQMMTGEKIRRAVSAAR